MCLNYRGRDYHYRKQKSINFIIYYLFDMTSPSQPPFESYNFIILNRISTQRVFCNKANLHKLSLNIHHPRIYGPLYFLLAKKVYTLS